MSESWFCCFKCGLRYTGNKTQKSRFMLTRKYRDIEWDFTERDSKTVTHDIHPYPAMMIPEVARKLVYMYGKKDGLLLDPFCGSGTSLLEANLASMNALGFDMNPLACLISRTKTTLVNTDMLEEEIAKYESAKTKNCSVPYVTNINYWFKPEVQQILAHIVDFISNIENCDVKDFFRVAASLTIRMSSLAKQSEFKLVRVPEKTIKKISRNPSQIMLEKLNKNLESVKELAAYHQKLGTTQVFSSSSMEQLPQNPPVDMILTSPPYGDSSTTVAYGQFSRMANEWFGYENASKLDKTLMGGYVLDDYSVSENIGADKCLAEIKEKDTKRAGEVNAFLHDYSKSIENTSGALKPGGVAAYIVGNRTVKGITIPLDEITARCWENNGLKHQKTIIREFPYKRMPKYVSPENIAGKKQKTMQHEYIVICSN